MHICPYGCQNIETKKLQLIIATIFVFVFLNLKFKQFQIDGVDE